MKLRLKSIFWQITKKSIVASCFIAIPYIHINVSNTPKKYFNNCIK